MYVFSPMLSITFAVCFVLLYFAVTIARAIELKHNANLIAALAFETANFYQKAGEGSVWFFNRIHDPCSFFSVWYMFGVFVSCVDSFSIWRKGGRRAVAGLTHLSHRLTVPS